MEFRYRIGGLRVDPAEVKCTGLNPFYEAAHRFVVGAEERTVSVYVAKARKHAYVGEMFGFGTTKDGVLILYAGKQLVGGGTLYTDRHDDLILSDYSGDFDAIPRIAGERFGGLIAPELGKIGITIHNVLIKVDETHTNPFWKILKEPPMQHNL